jgi:hypothetical protein
MAKRQDHADLLRRAFFNGGAISCGFTGHPGSNRTEV